MARHLGNIDYDIPFIEAFRANLQYMRRRGEYSSIIEEYAAFYSLGERLAVFWYEDIKTCPMGLMRDLTTFLRVDTEWASPDLHAVVAPNPDDSVIGARDAVEVSEYYAPFDRQLRSLLGIASLPWSYSQSQRVAQPTLASLNMADDLRHKVYRFRCGIRNYADSEADDGGISISLIAK